MYVRKSEIQEALELTEHGVKSHPQGFSFENKNYKVEVKFINGRYLVTVLPTNKIPSFFKRGLIKREIERYLSEVHDV